MNYKKKAMLYRLYKLDKPWALTGKKIADFYRSLLLIDKDSYKQQKTKKEQ